MISDQAVGLTGMVLSGTPRDTLNVVDLVYNPDGGPRPEVLITDAGSYSDVVFGVVTLLGFDYRPVLADLPDTKLWRIDAGADYGVLDKAARGRVNLAKIRRHWPDVLRVIASVHTREISAHDVIRVLQHDGRLTDLGEAVAYYGRIFKTLHVLTFAVDPGYRRHLKGMRNLQEQRHGLGRHVFHGRKGELYQAYHAGMEDQLGALGLVLNCITLWNTPVLGPRAERAPRPGLPGDRRRRRPAVGLPAQTHQRARPLLVCAARPRGAAAPSAARPRRGRGVTACDAVPADGVPGRW
jgi:TnpA family transposase